METAFEGVNKVFHCAALISFNPGDYNILKKTNIEGTANIVNLCISKNIEKLCYVSTIGTIGRSLDGSSANEETEWTDQDVNVYALTKYRAEMEVWRGSQEGLETVIINPGVILGPGFWGTGSGAFFTTAQKGYSYYPPGGTGFVTVHDVVTIMTDLMDSTLKNERYIVVAENLKFKKTLDMIAKPLGKRIPNKELKYWQLQIGRFFDWIFDLFTDKGRSITKNTITSLYQRDAYDNSKIKKALNFTFSPLEPTIQLCCEKFKEESPPS
ncbi:SDR family oxidoreductase [Maribacter halichondriae]|uniref:SDR family oxidoreductase n=1 Tax=Maribacter halichondriae TaxID=2980554 RepID=UPI003076548E